MVSIRQSGEERVRIGLLADSADPYWVEVRETLWQLASQTGELAPHPFSAAIELVEIEFIAAVHDDAAKVEEILALGLGALIAVPFAMPLLYQLLDSGLTIVALHERAVEHPRFVKPRSLYRSARLACEFLAEQLAGSGRVLVAGGRTTLEGRSSRLQAAYDVFAACPAVETVHLPLPWDRAGALEAARPALAELTPHLPPFRGIFGLSDTLALVSRELCAQQGLLAPDAVVVGINGDPLAIAAIARGEMAATVATSAAHLATEALRLACQAALGAALPTQYDYALQLVTADNVAEMALNRLVAISDVPSRLVGVNRRQEERRLMLLQTSLEINRRIGSILDGATLLREISELIRTNYGYSQVSVYLWNEQSQTLNRHLGPPELPAFYPLEEAGPLGRALLSGRPVYIPDVQRLPQTAGPAGPSSRTRVAAPIRLGSRTLGVLDVHTSALQRHAQADLDALQALADELGIALHNAQLFAEALQARAEAERANRLKTRLLANISHDLRAPLKIILDYSQAALAQPPLPAALAADLRHIHQSGTHLVRLVDDLLALSQAEIGALEIVLEPVELSPLLTMIFEQMARNAADGPVEWRLELPETLPLLYADPVRLRQVLLNLLTNAHYHTAAGRITLRAAAQGEVLHIWIEDTGHGISAARQQQLAAALEEAPEGAPFSVGLGLRVARHLLQLHGGTLHLESQPGHGTTCHLQLPLAQASHLPAPAEAAVASTPGPETQERWLQLVQQHPSERVRRIAAYIAEHHASALSRQEIASALQISDDYASRIFRKETGMTPWQYLHRYRIVQAQKLLQQSNQSVTEIGAQVGFSDPAYFIRVFHRESGKSPQQYRKSAK
ncbi:MAG: helix-turn-helix domain-containing protein [Caldilinea sp.]|jgi:signal transduction histidine kinase/AraC-like DNA-binding protein